MFDLPNLRDVVTKYELLAKKSLGQNFLLDTNITNKIIRLSLAAQNKTDFHTDFVYEIGPGPGGLTQAILQQNPQCLTVIEMDSRCIQIMAELKNIVGNKLQIIEGDALKFDYTSSAQSPQIISNLPYNISVPLLVGWLKNMRHFTALTLMFQKEVADRICAEPDNKNYGRISVLAQLTCNIKTLLNLNPNCFVPAPKIWSTVLLFQPLPIIPAPALLEKVEKITTLAFGQRRKMIRQSLKSIPNLESICRQADIDLTMRAENITPEQYLKLAELI